MTTAASALPAGFRARRPEPAHRRSHQPVHRDSRVDGPWVDQWYRRMTWSQKHRLLRAARAYDRAEKKPGEKNGPIGEIGLALLEELATLAVGCGGRVYPSLLWLAGRLKRSKSTVVEYLQRLADAGVLRWIRRLVPTDRERWARGPSVEQTSNAYRIELPKKLRKFARRPPAPADDAERKAAMRRRIDEAIRAEAADKLDAGIAAAAARGTAMKAAAAAAAERESSRRSETGQNSTSTRSSEGVRLPAHRSIPG